MKEYSELMIRHLELIQSTISRMASNSFLLKGWTITLIAGMFALASRDASLLFFMITYFPLLIFWCLDSYYLQTERRYRELYRKVLSAKSADFSLIPPKPCWSEKTMYIQSFTSKTEMGFYFPTAILILIVIALVNKFSM